MSVLRIRPTDPYGRSSPKIPRYRSIKHLAVIFAATGLAEVIVGVSGLLTAALPAVSASLSDSAVAALVEARARHDTERKAQIAEIEKQNQLLAKAHPDAREMLSDRILALRKGLRRADEDWTQEIEGLETRVRSAAGYRQRLWGAFFNAWTWCHSVIAAGLVSLGIAQVITAFRDMAINSFLRLRE